VRPVSKGLVSVVAVTLRGCQFSETKMETQSTNTIEIIAPRAASKQAKLMGMLSRKSGVTIAKASEALGWQMHTTRATLTGLKKRGYLIERKDRDGKDSIYCILPTEAK